MSDESDGRVRRGQESREARRGQIKQTALEVFSRKGYHETSVTDLVDAAGVARGTFYLYFDGKEAIFVELLDELVGELRSSIRGIDTTPGAASMEEQLQGVVVRILRLVVEKRALTRIIFREAVGLHAVVDQRLRAFDDDIHAYVARALQLGVALGRTRSVDPEVGAVSIVGAVRELVSRLVVRPDVEFDVDAVARALVDYHLRGLAPR